MMNYVTDKETGLLIAIGTTLFLACVLIAISITPENCVLIGSNAPNPFACDGITFPPTPCRICADQRTALVAQLIAAIGALLLLLPALVNFVRWQTRSMGAEESPFSAETENKMN